MFRRALVVAVIIRFAGLVGTVVFAQAPTVAPPVSRPAATRVDIECSGFITTDRIARTVRVTSGADDDFFQPLRQFIPGDFVYLQGRGKEDLRVGVEYEILRQEERSELTIAWSPGQIEKQIEPPISWYPWQRWSVRQLGHRYLDSGRVKVVAATTPHDAVAQVEFACGPINTGDLAVPYQVRPIPDYTFGMPFDRFPQPTNQGKGRIVAGARAAAYVGQGDIAYLNLGEQDGARAGQRYRIYATLRRRLLPTLEDLRLYPRTPSEAVGELVVLSTQKKSSVAMVIRSIREISVGDSVELVEAR